jgi:hypothetical protein
LILYIVLEAKVMVKRFKLNLPKNDRFGGPTVASPVQVVGVPHGGDQQVVVSAVVPSLKWFLIVH